LSTHLAELEQVVKKEPVPRQQPTVRVKGRWIPPTPGVTKINCDGAVSRSEMRGAVACVSRDEQGVFLGASATIYEGVINPEVLEALACSEYLSLAEDMMASRVHIASDCLNVIKEIKEGSSKGQNCRSSTRSC
jgi:ribonuclease HI